MPESMNASNRHSTASAATIYLPLRAVQVTDPHLANAKKQALPEEIKKSTGLSSRAKQAGRGDPRHRATA